MHSTAVRAYSNAHFGQGRGSIIWLDDVTCTGREARLLDCPAQPLGSHDCAHKEDAGVSCDTSRGTINYTVSALLLFLFGLVCLCVCLFVVLGRG